MQIEMRPITSIRPYENNPRLNDAAVDAVAASIERFGFRQPIVVDVEGVIVVGHTRYRAALKLGMTVVPVHVAEDLTPAEARAYRIADNQTATLSSWDDLKLPQELAALQDMRFDLDFTGFCREELDRLLNADASPGVTDPDALPDPPESPTTRTGDLIVFYSQRHDGQSGVVFLWVA
jgi:site-specific DNA-methyltransferase (adenine-specific)